MTQEVHEQIEEEEPTTPKPVEKSPWTLSKKKNLEETPYEKWLKRSSRDNLALLARS
jgi:hypothetical protein